MGYWESNPKREIHSVTGLSQKTRKAQINNLTLHLKELEKEQTKASRRKEIIKIRGEINDIDTKKKIQKINESRSLFFEKINKIDEPLSRLIKKKKRNNPNK